MSLSSICDWTLLRTISIAKFLLANNSSWNWRQPQLNPVKINYIFKFLTHPPKTPFLFSCSFMYSCLAYQWYHSLPVSVKYDQERNLEWFIIHGNCNCNVCQPRLIMTTAFFSLGYDNNLLPYCFTGTLYSPVYYYKNEQNISSLALSFHKIHPIKKSYSGVKFQQRFQRT